VANLAALSGAPNGRSAVTIPLTSFSWCQASKRPTGAWALRFSGMAARAAMLPAFAHFFHRQPGERIRARQAPRPGQQLGVLDQAARIPGRGNSTAGQGAHRRILHDAKIHSSNLALRLGAKSARPGPRQAHARPSLAADDRVVVTP
jgi:hypothetical protein